MRRKLFTLAVAFSTVLCVAVVAVGVWSSNYPLHFERGDSTTGVQHTVGASDYTISIGTRWGMRPLFVSHIVSIGSFIQSEGWDVAGIHYHRRSAVITAPGFGLPPPGNYGNQTEFRFSIWWLFVVFLVTPAVFVWKVLIQRRGRVRYGLCLSCGYDLRASPGRCPECGTVPAPKAAT